MVMNVENARQFAAKWKDRGNEKQDTMLYWVELLSTVFEMPNAMSNVAFEQPVPNLKTTDFRDVVVYNGSETILIEQKGLGTDMSKPLKQSDGAMLTPYEQAERYDNNLPYDEKSRWIITCNFASFWIYDMNLSKKARAVPVARIALEDLPKRMKEMSFLVGSSLQKIEFAEELELSKGAGDLVGKLYDELLKGYPDAANPSKETLHHLNMLCVQIVFCLYAEDAGIFDENSTSSFRDYLEKYDVDDWHDAITRLFTVFNTPYDNRSYGLSKALQAFPYVNGGLFAVTPELPVFTDTAKDLIIEQMSKQFDWSRIIPTIFGAIFESTLNPETRRSGGMHYTSLENIHRVIDPLFLDDLRTELQTIKAMPSRTPGERTKRDNALRAMQDKIAELKFLDPAAGSGNFLTETYLCLRRLENEIISLLNRGAPAVLYNPIKVSIQQMYGIEINDFAVSVARTALWIAEAQMYRETKNIVNFEQDFLPLKTFENIREGNALQIDWNGVLDRRECSYIMGNPPFVGARIMSPKQKADVFSVFGKDWYGVGNIDYVACWYKKASQYIGNTNIECAFVSTNSICQGEQVPILWKPLFEEGIIINFARRTFIWDSEANMKAHVHCVIVGFAKKNKSQKKIYDEDKEFVAQNINGYLIDGDNVFVINQTHPICKDAPIARSGNKPIDDGNYLFAEEEYFEFISKEPNAKQYFRPWIGSYEFINRKKRYCLWLGDCAPSVIAKMPLCLDRVKRVREFRLNSKSSGTVKLADKPTRFHVETFLNEPFLVLPLTSSERRKYVPIGFITPDYLASNLVIVVANAKLFHFGILTSNVFMAWMRAFCGRLKSDYRITKDNIYNNFPWPVLSNTQQSVITKTASMILHARDKYTDSTFAEMYGENMFLYPDLVKAHEANDAAVMEAYGFKPDMTESEIVAELMKLYQQAVNKQK